MKIKKLLIANRAEIAIRIMRTCQKLGIKTVSLYTLEEENLPQRFIADDSVLLEGNSLSETYLNIDKIISIAKEYGCDAIHPGYGFLSENAEFCKKVVANDLIFVGPTPDSITMMGDKKGSKEKMIELGVPTIPGYHGANQDADHLKSEACKIGYPVLIKASAGGGGKGMRIVYDEKDFLESLDSCKREAIKSFGSDVVLIEKFIENPRHIEIQVMSDNHGNHFHFFDRECSIQRRHQKIIEEAPSIALNDELREKMTQTSVHITKSINYSGAGTIEYILDGDQFYFLEMNTRLQVEHPVTEMITGFDLVRLQLVAAGNEEFDFDQDDIEILGHSIECRIYAEDPDNDFLPSIGRLKYIGDAEYSEARLECGYSDGNEITINFDPMIAKVISTGEDREEAIERSLESLKSIPFFGLKTNIEYLSRILNSEPFYEGDTYTHFVKTYEDILGSVRPSRSEVIAALMHKLPISHGTNPWDSLSSFRLGEDEKVFTFYLDEEEISISVNTHFESFTKIKYQGSWSMVKLVDQFDDICSYIVDRDMVTVVSYDDDVIVNGKFYKLTNNYPKRSDDSSGAEGDMLSPMPGKILKLIVEPGASFKTGDSLVIMEAMKMEHTIKASTDGKLLSYLVKEGELISGDARLIDFE